MGQSNGVKTDLLSWSISSLYFTFHITEDEGARISYKFCYVCTKLHVAMTQQTIINVFLASGLPRGGLGCLNPPEIPKALQNRAKQPDFENC